MIFNSVAIASDHRGFWLKSDIIEHFQNLGYEFVDRGTSSDCVSVDYPDYAQKVTDYVLSHENACGILICYSGLGMSMAANRRHGVRAALCLSEEMAKLSREHNNANVICFGSGFMTPEEVFKCLEIFFSTQFDERHLERIQKLDEFSKED